MTENSEQELGNTEIEILESLSCALQRLYLLESGSTLDENGLSNREKEICREVKKSGFNPKLNAENLCIAECTFKKHVENIREKKNIHAAAELMKYIYDHLEEIEDQGLKIRYIAY